MQKLFFIYLSLTTWALAQNHDQRFQEYTQNSDPNINPFSTHHQLGLSLNNPWQEALTLIQEKTHLQAKITNTNKNIATIQLYFNESPICNSKIKAVRHQSGLLSIIGRLPNPPNQTYIPKITKKNFTNKWPRSLKKIPILKKYKNWKTQTKPKICYSTLDNNLTPLWQLQARGDNLHNYRLWFNATDNTYYSHEPIFFEIENIWKLFSTKGWVQAYKNNPKEGILAREQFDLTGDGSLSSLYFETSDFLNKTMAFKEDNDFTYSPSEDHFAEASSFFHATKMHEYFKTLGYKWIGPKPLKLRINTVFDGSHNNALYEPSTLGLPPRISLGKGDGRILKNLSLDADVVRHEFSHHIIYPHLPSVAHYQIPLHEGLADFFVNMFTDNPCLGPSICPQNSNACIIRGQCLRSANLPKLKYNTDLYIAFNAHQKGQVISNLLWDLRQYYTNQDLVAMVYYSMNFLPLSGSIPEFLLALLLADHELFQSQNSCNIVKAADNRNFTALLKNIDCQAPPLLTPQEEEPPMIKILDEKQDECGGLIKNPQFPQNTAWLILIIPLIFQMILLITSSSRRNRRSIN